VALLFWVTILVVSLVMVWSILSPAEAPLSETPAESQEPRGNWEEPMVQAVQKVGPATVRIETTREMW
jgi:S1-C subfamily serine protease